MISTAIGIPVLVGSLGYFGIKYVDPKAAFRAARLLQPSLTGEPKKCGFISSTLGLCKTNPRRNPSRRRRTVRRRR